MNYFFQNGNFCLNSRTMDAVCTLEFREECASFIYFKNFQFLLLIKGYDNDVLNPKRLFLSLKHVKYV